MTNFNARMADKIQNLIADEYEKANESYTIEDINDIVLALILTNDFTSKSSVQNLIDDLEKIKESHC